MLTKKQQELLVFINERLAESGVSPSFEEMKEALNLKSKSGIHRLISGLEERGFIRRLAHRARALEVVKLPDAMASAAKAQEARTSEARTSEARTGERGTKFSPTVIRGDFKSAFPGAAAAETEAVQLPLYGRIAAGTPIAALRDTSTMIGIPAGMLAGTAEHYALEVAGDSMIDAGVLDGDTVIIQRCDTADNGTIVVALVDDEEVTLKRIRRKGASIALEPANKTYETRIFGPDRVKVQGRLVGLMRRY
jgi:repressor LexA